LTELVARLPRPRAPYHLPRLAAALGVALVLAGALVLEHRPQAAASPAAAAVATPKPVVAVPKPVRAAAARHRVSPLVSARLAQSAARGLDRGIFAASPGGVAATAARVAGWRPEIVRAARRSGIGPNLLEAMVFVESSGYGDAISAHGAAGLTQLSPRAARRLGLRVNSARSRALTNRIARADSRGAFVTARQLRRWRLRYDQRFSASQSLRATVGYLRRARHALGRDDLAVQAYHVGIGSVSSAVRAYGTPGASYAQLYFGSSPDEHARAWRALESGGAYYWKVLAAKRVMSLYRQDPSALRFEEGQQAKKLSAEEVLHPRFRTFRFSSPSTIARGWRARVLRAIPLDARETHIAIGPFFGDQAHKLGRSRRLYRGLRPATLDVLLYIGKRVHEISGARKPLILTSALRDNRYQRVLMRVNANAARTYSIHTTGYAFDIARAYSTAAQAAAFQFVLDRLVAVNAIAYIREAAAIHVAVASDADRKLALLRRLG
jgi:soluble lytic murein transglycosylase-like protein